MRIYRTFSVTLFLATFLAIAIAGCPGGCPGAAESQLSAGLPGAPPTVVSTIPINRSRNVFINRKIVATFSDEMDCTTLTDKTFTLAQTSVAVSGVVTCLGRVAIFAPTNHLEKKTVYTATITTGAFGSHLNHLAADRVWTFTTGEAVDTFAPTVLFTAPKDGATGVFLNGAIAATFSEPMDPTTINTTTFKLMQGTTPIVGKVSWAGVMATFKPDRNLRADTDYTATVTTGVTDLAIPGNALASNKVWTFKTGSSAGGGGGGGGLDTTAPTVVSTSPADGADNQPINATVAATFDDLMDTNTITLSTFTLDCGGPILGTLAFTGALTTTATFTPDSNLPPSETCTATVTTGVEDTAGNALASNEVWTFTTGTEEAQTISQAPGPVLGTSGRFAILASAAITDIPTSIITGDVGLTPDTGANITGFSSPLTCPEVTLNVNPVTLITGNIFAVDSAGPACAINVNTQVDPFTGLVNPTLISDAKADALAAFLDANTTNRNGATEANISTDLGGLTLYPGLYGSGTTIELHGDLYLDALGDEDAVFVIRSSNSITTFDPSEVHLIGGAKAINVYWSAGSAVTIGVGSIMKGTIIAGTAITLNAGANLEGRALNQGPSAAAISVESSTITLPSP